MLETSLSNQQIDFPSIPKTDHLSCLIVLSSRLAHALESAAISSNSEQKKRLYRLYADIANRLHSGLERSRYGEK